VIVKNRIYLIVLNLTTINSKRTLGEVENNTEGEKQIKKPKFDYILETTDLAPPEMKQVVESVIFSLASSFPQYIKITKQEKKN